MALDSNQYHVNVTEVAAEMNYFCYIIEQKRLTEEQTDFNEYKA